MQGRGPYRKVTTSHHMRMRVAVCLHMQTNGLAKPFANAVKVEMQCGGYQGRGGGERGGRERERGLRA